MEPPFHPDPAAMLAHVEWLCGLCARRILICGWRSHMAFPNGAVERTHISP